MNINKFDEFDKVDVKDIQYSIDNNDSNSLTQSKKAPAAIPFIIYNEHTNTYEHCNEALDLIGAIHSEIIFISIAGRQRSGKSLLLNKLLWKLKASEFESCHFLVGDTINPCTEGLWIYNKPIWQEGKAVFLIDSEGKDSLTKDKKHDAKLMSIISVLSSFFVLNVKAIMDLEEFYILDTIAYFSVKLFNSAQEDDHEDNGEEGSYTQHHHHQSNFLTPNLVILMRDFDLLMEDPETHQPISDAQFLEQMLRLESNKKSDNQKLNPMKNRICNQFQKRKLVTLPFPAELDERMMYKLKTLPMDQFNPEFIDKFDEFFTHLSTKMEVKIQNGTKFTGKIVSNLVHNLIESLNSNQMLELDFAWKQMIENEFIQLSKLYSVKLKNKFKELESKLPLSLFEFSIQLDKIKDSINEVMEEEICKKNQDKMTEIWSFLRNGFHGLKNDITEKNNSMGISHNSDMSNQFHKKVNNLQSTYLIENFNVSQYCHQSKELAQEQLSNLINNSIEFKNQNCISSKYDIIIENSINHTIQHQDDNINELQTNYNQEITSKNNEIKNLNMKINTLVQDLNNQVQLTSSEKERNMELVGDNSMMRNQLNTCTELNTTLQDNLDFVKDSNVDLNKLINSRNQEIQNINLDNKKYVEKITIEKEDIYQKLSVLQTKYDGLSDQNKDFIEYKFKYDEKLKENKDLTKKLEEKMYLLEKTESEFKDYQDKQTNRDKEAVIRQIKRQQQSSFICGQSKLAEDDV